tara:strand:+ start:186 stop:1817 length:1632 start_codon:yes stop_codon:yes gene_type:complete
MRAYITICILQCACLGWSAEHLHQSIDRLIKTKAGGPIAGKSNDPEFFRRVQLDLAGQIPTSKEVRDFIQNKNPNKRAKLIDQLLANDTFAEHWTDRLSVMLLERQNLGKINDEDWRSFLIKQLKKEPRWDVMAYEMITADGKGDTRAAMRFLGNANHERMTKDIARLFLGMDLQCAKCHDHPSVDEWKQAHFWGLFAYLNQTKSATHSKNKLPYFVENLATKKVEFQSVFEAEKKSTGPYLPGGKEIDIPTFEKGQEYEKPAADGLPAVPKFRPRELMARELTSNNNRYFTRNAVNRLWYLMMGRGLSHPLDEVHAQNPPSHPQLMKLLMKEFAAHKFDVKWFIREIALSESYQRSSKLPQDAKQPDPALYITAHPKALTPEQLLRAILKATGNTKRVEALKADPNAEKFDRRGYFTGSHRELPSSYEEIKAVFMETFAQPAGQEEVEFLPGLNKALFLMNDRLLLSWLHPQGENLVARVNKLKDPKSISEELYFNVLGRPPVKEEIHIVSEYLEKQNSRRTEALGELVWSLLTSIEFRINH